MIYEGKHVHFVVLIIGPQDIQWMMPGYTTSTNQLFPLEGSLPRGRFQTELMYFAW